MLTHRLQLLLDDERYERVHVLARQRGTSVAAVIRAGSRLHRTTVSAAHHRRTRPPGGSAPVRGGGRHRGLRCRPGRSGARGRSRGA